MPDMMLTTNELAERLGVPLKTVYAWNERGTGPRYLKIGRYVRYRRSDVEQWEESRYADQLGGMQ